MPILIALLLICLAVSTILVLLLQRRQKEQAQYLRAAKNIVQNELLEYSLKNPVRMQGLTPPARRRMMMLLRTNTNPPQRVVYDPAKPITMGRNPKECTFYLSDPSVSLHHCCIFAQGPKVFLQDQGSVNGTVLRRGFFKKYRLRQGQPVALCDGDRIYVGSLIMKVHLFLFDDAIM